MYNSVFSVYKSVFLQESVPSKSFKEKLKHSTIKVQENKINKICHKDIILLTLRIFAGGGKVVHTNQQTC